MGNMYYLNADGTTGAQFVNPGAYTGTTSSASGNTVITPGADKSFEFKFGIPTAGSLGTWTTRCYTYPLEISTRNVFTDKRQEISDAFSVIAPVVSPSPSPSPSSSASPSPSPSGGATNSTVTANQLFPGQYNNVKFSLVVADPEGIKDFSVRTSSGASLYGGSPGAPGNVGSCTGSSLMRSVTSGTVDIVASDFPLQISVTDCRIGAGFYSFTIPDVRLNPSPSPSASPGASPSPSPSSSPRSCGPSEKCPSGSWCSSGGRQCYYPDSQMTCAAWSTGTNTTCPSGTSMCGPNDTNCRVGSQYGPAETNCMESMRCYQKTVDTNSQNDVYCAPTPTALMTTAMMPASMVSCPSGYGVCSATDRSCLEKGESRTDTNTSYYCINSQRCPLSGGGVSCVGYDETCPTGTKFCSAGSPGPGGEGCLEFGETKKMTSTNSSYWCGGSNGMTFYNITTNQAHCAQRPAGASMMWIGSDVKAQLDRLGPGWGVCSPNNPGCGEPGKSGQWCGWVSPYSSSNPMPYTPNGNTTRICPSLDDTGTVPPPNPSPVPPGTSPVPPSPIPPPIVDPMRECAPGEMPMFSTCQMPRYKWNIAEKKFEKCASNENTYYASPATGVQVKQKYTSCQSMIWEFEKEWRTERYLKHPPEVDGEWYTPPWDAAAKTYRYDPKTDELEACTGRELNPTVVDPIPGQPMPYMSPCMPVPEIDRDWMLKKLRSEHKMSELYRRKPLPVPLPVPPGKPGDPVKPLPMPLIPPPIVDPVPVPEIPVGQCKQYLTSTRQSSLSHKNFWKDVKRQLDSASDDYADRDTVSALLTQAKDEIVKIDTLIKAAKCTSESLKELQSRVQTLSTDIFPELSGYLPDLRNFAEYAQCRSNLTSRYKEVKKILEKDLDEETKAEVKDLVSSMDEKFAEMQERASDFEYDVTYECTEFSDEIESRIAPLLIEADEGIKKIVDDVISKKLTPVLEKLAEQLEEKNKSAEDKQKNVDELLVKVAQLHQAVEQVGKSAEQFSQQLADSYKGLTAIQEKFAEQKEQIKQAKEELLPLVQQALQVINESRCVRGGDRDQMVKEFENVATVNWVGDRSDDIERRIQLFISSCRARDWARNDIENFRRTISESSDQNQSESFRIGLAPFADVTNHAWYAGGMMYAKENNIMSSGNPGGNVLRQDALIMIARAAGATDADIVGSCAVPAGITGVSSYASCAARFASLKGLALRGDMSRPASRGEVAVWIDSLLSLPEVEGDVLAGYADVGGVPPQWRSSIARIVASGVMVGSVTDTKKTFNPYDNLTRASLAVMLENLGTRN